MSGIIEFRNTLLRADRVVYAEQNGNDVDVSTDAFDDEITYENCSIADFRDAWRKAITY